MARIDSGGNVENHCDAAIAEVQTRDWNNSIRVIGSINGTAQAAMNGQISKVGRTTDLTNGTIRAVDADVTVTFRGSAQGRSFQFSAWFIDQISVQGNAGRFTRPGDSGSVYLDNDQRIVGLHFAAAHGRSLGNHIANVFDTLGLELIPELD